MRDLFVSSLQRQVHGSLAIKLTVSKGKTFKIKKSLGHGQGKPSHGHSQRAGRKCKVPARDMCKFQGNLLAEQTAFASTIAVFFGPSNITLSHGMREEHMPYNRRAACVYVV